MASDDTLIRNAPAVIVLQATAARWTAVNALLSEGELGFESDTLKFKIGDGLTRWASLSYVSSGSGGTSPAEQTVADAGVAWVGTNTILRRSAALTANRTVTMPLANSVTAGSRRLYIDPVTASSSAFSASFAAAGGDTVAGSGSYTPFSGPGTVELESDGVSAWTPVHSTGKILLLQDTVDPSKILQFSLSNITTGTTRTANAPDANSTLVQPVSVVAGQFLTGMNAQGLFTQAAPSSSVYTVSTPLITDVAIANQQTPTTGGVTLSATLANGSLWRIKAYGDYTAANSATARNLEITPFWNATALPKVASVIKTSSAATDAWSCDFLIKGTSTTAAWTTGFIATQSSGATTGLFGTAASASTGSLTSGATTLDLRFDTSVSVAGDVITVKQVIMERLA